MKHAHRSHYVVSAVACTVSASFLHPGVLAISDCIDDPDPFSPTPAITFPSILCTLPDQSYPSGHPHGSEPQLSLAPSSDTGWWPRRASRHCSHLLGYCHLSTAAFTATSAMAPLQCVRPLPSSRPVLSRLLESAYRDGAPALGRHRGGGGAFAGADERSEGTQPRGDDGK